MLNSYQKARLFLATAAIVCFLIFLGAGKTFGLPPVAGFDGSLLEQPTPLVSLIIVLVVLIVTTLIGTLISGTIRFDAGLFVATFGMVALSIRGGTMSDVLRNAATTGIFFKLAVETFILFSFVAVCWAVLWLMHGRGWLLPNHKRDGIEDDEVETVQSRAVGIGVQVAVMVIVMLFCAQADAKYQAVVSVFVSSLLGTYAAYYFAPLATSVWYWMGPMIVGVFGYLVAMTGPDGWNIGQINGFFAPLARPIPLDYASVGTAGAIMGFWMSRRWRRSMQLTETETA